jgi:hypothetical protein
MTAQGQLTRAEAFMPGLISTDSIEFNAAFSPDGQSFYFSRSINKRSTIFGSVKSGNTWTTPVPVSFATPNFSDADPAFSPNGDLYFISNRPQNAADTTKDYDIWKVFPIAGSQWSEPVNVSALNSDKDEFYISFTKNGDAYFSSSREGGYGEEDLYVSENKRNQFSKPGNLGDQINSSNSEYDPFVTADGSALIFTSSGRKDSFGKADLYWSIKIPKGWTDTRHFDATINTATRDYCPYITYDSKLFFYSSEGDIKFIPTGFLPEAFRFILK